VPFSFLEEIAKAADKVSNVSFDSSGEAGYSVNAFTIRRQFHPEDVATFPSLPPAANKWHQTNIASEIFETAKSASTDETRYVLNGVYLDTKEGNIVGTNGRCLDYFSDCAFGTLTEEAPAIIPSDTVFALKKIDATGWHIGFSETRVKYEGNDEETVTRYIHFNIGPWCLISRSIDGNYPNYKQVIPGEETAKVILKFSPPQLDTFAQTVPRLPRANNTPHDPVTICISEGNANFSTDPKALFNLRPTILLGSDKDVQVSAEREFWMRGLIGSGLNTVRLIDALSPIVFTSERRTFVVMPLRIA
jgi:DNA polymerase-3 subunit beta